MIVNEMFTKVSFQSMLENITDEGESLMSRGNLFYVKN